MSDPRRALVWKGVFEVVLISIGVFLAMEADQWRTNQQHREQARATLQRFKDEIERNRKAVTEVKDYHVQLHGELKRFTEGEPVRVQMQGIRPVAFEHTAWDLAIATQSLAEIDASLAYEMTRLYGAQETYAGLSSGMLQAMYLRPPSENWKPFLHTVRVYLDDIVGLEPGLIEMYDRILPLIDRALRD